jgi:hypothetical protein
MKNKKYLNFLAAGFLLANIGGIQRQINPNLIIATPTPTPVIKPILISPNIIKKIDLIELKFTNKRGELKNVKVTVKDATSITVDNEGTGVKVDVQTNTHLRRKFWGKSSLAEISVGDNVDVIGRWANEDKTEIKAVVIRDLSIQKRFGVFFGTVKSITDTGFIMTTIQRGEETVTIDSAKLIDRTGKPITKSDILVGQKIRVRGLWNSNNFTITETSEVKDFSLP